MTKKIIGIIVLVIVILSTGCSCSKSNLLEDTKNLLTENEELNNDVEKYENIDELFDFYNELSTITAHSFVLIESKHVYTLKTNYSDGVIVASNGYDYYILADYNQLWVSQNIQYRIMNANAEVYNAQLLKLNGQNLYDEETGLVLLKARVGISTTSKMQSINLSTVSETFANMSNVEQLNKIQLFNKDDLEEYFYVYDEQEYSIYKLFLENSGSLVNSNNDLCGFYLSKLEGYVSSNLIKKVAYATYSLIL